MYCKRAAAARDTTTGTQVREDFLPIALKTWLGRDYNSNGTALIQEKGASERLQWQPMSLQARGKHRQLTMADFSPQAGVP
jgi:hypothetical protein